MITNYMNTQHTSLNEFRGNIFETKKRYAEEGYFIVKNLVPDYEVDGVRREAIDVFNLQIKNHNINTGDFETDLYQLFKEHPQIVINCGKQIQQNLSLIRLSVDSRISGWCGFAFACQATRQVLFFHNKKLAKEEIYYKIPAHRDAPSMDSSSDAMIVWLPLVDVDKKLGTLQIVPGTHTKNIKTSRHDHNFALVDGFEDKDFIDVELKKGDGLFFHSKLVHRSGDNVTENIRWAANFRFSNLWDPDFIKRGFPSPYIYKSTATENPI